MAYATDTPIPECAEIRACDALMNQLRADEGRPATERALCTFMAEAHALLFRATDPERRDPQNITVVCLALARSAETLAGTLRQLYEAEGTAPPVAPPVPLPPTVTGIEPTTAVVGGPDLTLHVLGTGFDVTSRILWNGAEEPTVYVSPTMLTTLVKPSTASGPWPITVGVTGAAETYTFQFLEEASA